MLAVVVEVNDELLMSFSGAAACVREREWT